MLYDVHCHPLTIVLSERFGSLGFFLGAEASHTSSGVHLSQYINTNTWSSC